MKKMLILVLVLSFFFVTFLSGEEKVATSGGRWQLLQVSYNGKDGNRSGGEIIAVLKIDTETGKTYRLLSKMDNGIPTEDRFIEIEDVPVPPKEKKETEQDKNKGK